MELLIAGSVGMIYAAWMIISSDKVHLERWNYQACATIYGLSVGSWVAVNAPSVVHHEACHDKYKHPLLLLIVGTASITDVVYVWIVDGFLAMLWVSLLWTVLELLVKIYLEMVADRYAATKDKYYAEELVDYLEEIDPAGLNWDWKLTIPKGYLPMGWRLRLIEQTKASC